MTAVLERAELEASPLADLHAIADQIGLDGFRRLRKADLIDAILERTQGAEKPARTRRARAERADGDGASAGASRGGGEAEEGETAASTPRRRSTRARRTRGAGEDEERGGARRSRGTGEDEERGGARRSRGTGEEERGGGRRSRVSGEEGERHEAEEERPRGARGSRGGGPERVVEGVVELLGNGSAFLRVSPPEASDEDAYISAAQVRRCELVSGDRVNGPVRTPRSSERYPSLARVDSINGVPADAVAEGVRYEDLPVAYPSQRLELDADDPTLGAIEWLTPIGRGSRVTISGPARSGKSETLRRLLGALAGREGLQIMVVLSGVRPEEISAFSQDAQVAPAAALSFAASTDLQGQTVEHVVETARRVAARGEDVVVLIDGLDGLHPHVARKILANARNLAEGGSLTLIATATRPLGGESTVIALDLALASTGHFPALDLAASGTIRPELLVGEDGAAAITRARANALKG
ncbi:MAG TPA: Rho termination factor N-terminal domain-containing protein [Solirubrobacteraceae bacterium]|nr:Rho termination factor N-terminal domain-containing protein [Solirubrobacteraceae bacterium]